MSINTYYKYLDYPLAVSGSSGGNDMKEELESKLIEILDRMINGIDSGADFMSQEIPDYLNQLLTWFGIYYGLMFVLGLALISFPILVFKFYPEVASDKPKKGEPLDWSWVRHGFDDVTKSTARDVADVFTITFSVILFIVGLFLINLQWLQIMIAPKVWLVEYLKDLV